MRLALCLLLAVVALAHCAAVNDALVDDASDEVSEVGFEDVVDEVREGRAGKRRASNATTTRTPTTSGKRTSPTSPTKRTASTTPGKRTTSTKRVVATTPMPLRNVTLVVKSTAATTTTTAKSTVTTTTKGKKKASLAKTTPSTPMETETPKLYYPNRRPRPEVVVDKTTMKPMKPTKPMSGIRLPEGATAAGLTKPTKYHYYPHNQHIYLLPECAIQQVCNAVYVRLNFTQPLCACPTRYQEPCSASLRADDMHTTPLVTDPRGRALTLVKTCEPVAEMRRCKAPRDWALLALQNVRTGKSHYLVLCRCPDDQLLEGPMNHDQPSYASVPGIRVYGMMCVQQMHAHAHRQARPLRTRRHLNQRSTPALPWARIQETVAALGWDP